MTTVNLTVNGKPIKADIDPRTLLVQFIRDNCGLTGTHVGCDTAQCGACTVHLDGTPVRSCSTPVAAADGAEITTVEGVGNDDGTRHAVQAAWVEHQVPQCGYCQSGQIMSAVALLRDNPDPTDEDIDAAMSGNICRCGAYGRIRAAIKTAARA